MAKNLVIVESPAKAKTINKILGSQFEVTSSMGHLRDLPASTLGVDVENNFEPHYIIIQKRRKFAKELQAMARTHDVVYLAPDPDREGEAISWHLQRILLDDAQKQAEKAAKKAAKRKTKRKIKRKSKAKRIEEFVPTNRKIYRIVFHEITPQAIKAAINSPKEINSQKVDAQQARRILDRLFGYSLSPLLWRKVGRGLSAGRVQSITLKIIVDREKEIEAFVAKEYWTLEVDLKKEGEPVFVARLDKIDGKKIEIGKKAIAEKVAAALREESFLVTKVDEKEHKRYPKPPFTTSTLQQEAYHKLRFSSAKTMAIAQQLYEGLEVGGDGPTGLITYMRTDAVRIADSAMESLRAFIPEHYGKDYLSEQLRKYKAKKSAQEAHEAVRPTDVLRTPESLKGAVSAEQFNLYQLIWQRFVASQMSDAVDRVIAAHISAGKHQLKASGRTNIFAGWTKVYKEVEDKEQDEDKLPEGVLPPLAKDDMLELIKVNPSQHFTKPPPRYNDASLVKALEDHGIGRPSTYAPTIRTIVTRDYVERSGGSFVPTKLGRIVTELLMEHFPEIMELKFTAEMEEELDRVEEGSVEWVSVVRRFYTPFSAQLAIAEEQMKEMKRESLPTDFKCDKCQKPMVIKWGRFGQFLSCSDYPDCKNAGPVPTGVKCPEENCGGDLVLRKSRGRKFYGCSNYPNCRHTVQKLPEKLSDESADKPATSKNSESAAPPTEEKSQESTDQASPPS